MSTTRPFDYNTGSSISGTIQVGDLVIVNIYNKAFNQSQLTSYWNAIKSRFGL